MKKTYLSPIFKKVEVNVESLLTSFSSSGEIDGPTGMPLQWLIIMEDEEDEEDEAEKSKKRPRR